MKNLRPNYFVYRKGLQFSNFWMLCFVLIVFLGSLSSAESPDADLKAHFAKCGTADKTSAEAQCTAELDRICASKKGSTTCLKIFMAQAKMSEAKKKLATGWTALQVLSSEKGAYPESFKDFWAVYGQGDDKGVYVLGFPYGCGGRTKPQSSMDLAVAHSSEVEAVKGKITSTFKSPPAPLNCVNPKKSFILMAVGDLGWGQMDIWTITDKREIRHVQNGILIP